MPRGQRGLGYWEGAGQDGVETPPQTWTATVGCPWPGDFPFPAHRAALTATVLP